MNHYDQLTKTEIVRIAARDFMRNDFHLSAGLLDYLLSEEGYSIERLTKFISRRLHVEEQVAREAIEFLCFH